MTAFQLIQVGDKVFDSIQLIQGTVSEINTETNIALVTVSEEESILCKLANLVAMNKSDTREIPIKNLTVKQAKSDGNKWFNQVKDFQIAFNHPAPTVPAPLTLERMTSRKIWELEESVEAIHASSSNEKEFNEAVDKLIQGVEQARNKSLNEDFPQDDLSRIVAQADALIDGSYFLQGDFVELSIEPDKLFDAVQQSNMSKLFTSEDGNKFAKYRESDGKILKSPEFFPPEPALKAEIERQMKIK